MSETFTGHIIGGPVDPDYDGAVLTADLTVGDTVLHVDDTADFDEDAAERDARVILGLEFDTSGDLDVSTGSPLAYITSDDEAGTVTLVAASTVAASAGDLVYIEDPVSGAPVGRLEVMVAMDDSDTTGDALSALLDVSLLESVGDVELTGLAVEMEEDEDGQLLVRSFPGLIRRNGAVKGWAEDELQVTLPGDQTMFLTYRPIPETEHLRWDGDSQPFAAFDRDGYEVTIPDPSGALQLGDVLTMQYLYTDPTAYVPPAPAVEFIGFTSVSGISFDEIPLPDGTQEGDLLILAGVHGFFGGSGIINTNDARMTMTYQTLDDFGSHWHAMCAYGFADATNDAVLITGADPTSDVVAVLATYRVVGTRWLRSTLEGGVCAPPMPSPADLGIMIVANSAGPGGPGLDHDVNGGWTHDGGDTSTSQGVSVWSCQTGAPDAHLVQADDSDLPDIWAYLAIGFV